MLGGPEDGKEVALQGHPAHVEFAICEQFPVFDDAVPINHNIRTALVPVSRVSFGTGRDRVILDWNNRDEGLTDA